MYPQEVDNTQQAGGHDLVADVIVSLFLLLQEDTAILFVQCNLVSRSAETVVRTTAPPGHSDQSTIPVP
jgi:LAS superfamily LD-carboxypeptidase LdcB